MILQAFFLLVASLCFLPQVTGAIALLTGITFAMTFGQPFANEVRRWSQRCMATSIIGVGASMNLHPVVQAGVAGFGYTLISIVLTVALGICLGRLFKVSQVISYLIAAGTAICGGSAIAATSIAINAKEHDTSVALVTIFALNAVALAIFPAIGQLTNLTPEQFGVWSGIAIHDTSSVVGAALRFSDKSVELATTIKLARALWIVPLTYTLSYLHHHGSFAGQKIKKPWFILGFIAASCLFTFIPTVQPIGTIVGFWAKRLFIVTLFLVGSTLSRSSLKAVGIRPLFLAATLWIIVSILSWVSIKHGIMMNSLL